MVISAIRCQMIQFPGKQYYRMNYGKIPGTESISIVSIKLTFLA